MKRFSFALLCSVLVVGALSARAQVVPAATSAGWSLSAGGEGSAFQPDYFGNPSTAGASPNRLYGFGTYVDIRFTRWVQVEGEARWLKFNEYYTGYPPVGIGQTTFQVGPRIPIHTYGKFTPYGKALWGFGSGSGWLAGNAQVLTFGGGVDYRINRKFTLRAFDFEYQDWRITPTLYPYGGSVGLSYRIF